MECETLIWLADQFEVAAAEGEDFLPLASFHLAAGGIGPWARVTDRESGPCPGCCRTARSPERLPVQPRRDRHVEDLEESREDIDQGGGLGDPCGGDFTRPVKCQRNPHDVFADRYVADITGVELLAVVRGQDNQSASVGVEGLEAFYKVPDQTIEVVDTGQIQKLEAAEVGLCDLSRLELDPLPLGYDLEHGPAVFSVKPGQEFFGDLLAWCVGVVDLVGMDEEK